MRAIWPLQLFGFMRRVGRPCYPGHLCSDKLLHLPWRNQSCHMDQCLSGEIVKIGQILFDPKRRYACWSPPLWWSSSAIRWLAGQASSSGVLSTSHIVSNSIQVIEITISGIIVIIWSSLNHHICEQGELWGEEDRVVQLGPIFPHTSHFLVPGHSSRHWT